MVLAAIVAGTVALLEGGGDDVVLGRSPADAAQPPAAAPPSAAHWSASLGPDSAQVTAFAAAPEALYAGTIGSGIFKSTDGGRSWHATREGLPASLRVDALAVDPSHPATVYAGSGDGVFKSTDRGRHWHRSSRGLFPSRPESPSSRRHRLVEGYVFGLTIDAVRQGTIYATAGGTYKSVDGGRSWHPIQRLSTLAAFSQVAVSPDDPRLLLAHGTDVSGFTGWRLYESRDSGRTWRALGLRLPRFSGNAVAIDPFDASTFYVATTDRGLLRSTDAGGHWRSVTPGSIRSLVLDPLVAGRVYVAERDDVFVSTDGGENWHPVAIPLRDEEGVWTLWADAVRRDTLYASTGGRLLSSRDAGRTWTTTTNGLRAPAITAVAVGRGVLYAATQGSAAYRSVDSGRRWRPLKTAAIVWSLLVDPLLAHTVYAGTDRAGVLRSDDDGRTWRPANDGLTARRVLALTADTVRQILYAGMDFRGVFASADHGRTWRPTEVRTRTRAVAARGGNAYAGTANGYVWRSIDGGAWTQQGHVCCHELRALAVDQADHELVYAANSSGVSRSTDGGRTWRQTLSRVRVESLVADPARPGVVYAGAEADAGIYRSTDDGITWAPFDDGLPALAHGGNSFAGGVAALVFSPDGRRLYAGVPGSGVFARALEP